MRTAIVVLVLAAGAPAQRIARPDAAAPRDFAVMAWGSSPSDAEQLKWMKEAGLNISGFCRAADLEQVAAAGLACFVSDKRANGYDWQNLPADDELRKNVAGLAKEVAASPAALGSTCATSRTRP